MSDTDRYIKIRPLPGFPVIRDLDVDMTNFYNPFRCRSIMGCVDACPKELNPTAAIGKIRNRLLKEAV